MIAEPADAEPEDQPPARVSVGGTGKTFRRGGRRAVALAAASLNIGAGKQSAARPARLRRRQTKPCCMACRRSAFASARGVEGVGVGVLSGTRRPRRLGRAFWPCNRRRPAWVRMRSFPTCRDPRTTSPRRPGAAAGGPAPEGGTASSASAKVPSGRLAPRRPRTPTKRHQTPRDLPGILDGRLRDHLAMQLAAA